MSLLNFFRSEKKSYQQNSASLAKERLQIVVSHQRNRRQGPDYLPLLEQELIDVISKYVKIDREQVNVNLADNGDFSRLELNIDLGEEKQGAEATTKAC